MVASRREPKLLSNRKMSESGSSLPRPSAELQRPSGVVKMTSSFYALHEVMDSMAEACVCAGIFTARSVAGERPAPASCVLLASYRLS